MSRAAGARGSAMVEFALIVPLFYLIIFALVQLGIVFAGYCSAAYAGQVAVRYAIVHGGDNTVSGVCTSANITTLVAPYLWAAQVGNTAVTTTWAPNNYTGSTVTVSITLKYSIGIPYSNLSSISVGTSSSGTILY